MDLGFADATAVVTGGSKGMGRAVAEVLAAGTGRRSPSWHGAAAALDETVAALLSLGSPDAVGISVDMTDPASIAAGFGQVADRWGSLNAPGAHHRDRRGRFEDLNDADWDDAFTLGTMSAVRASALPPLLRAAEWAASLCSPRTRFNGRADPGAYTASKAAVTSVAKNLSKSLAPDGILVNAVCPGSIVTASFTENLREIFAAEGLDPTDPHDVMRWIEQTSSARRSWRAGRPDEALPTAYLVSRRNGYVTGACINADGGSDFV